MLKEIERFFKEEDGFEVVEIVVLLAAIVCVALIFRTKIKTFVGETLDKIVGADVGIKE